MQVKLLKSLETEKSMQDDLLLEVVLLQRWGLIVEGDHRIKFLEGLVADCHATCKELITSLACYFLASLQFEWQKLISPQPWQWQQGLGQPTSALVGWSDPGDAAKPKVNLSAKWTFLYKTSDHMKALGFVFCYEPGIWAKLVKTFIKTHQDSDLFSESGPENWTNPSLEFKLARRQALSGVGRGAE